MNLRTFTAVSAVSLLVLGGCIIETTNTNDGGGGSGATGGGSSSSSSGTAGTGGTAGAGVGGNAGAGGAPACAKTCGEAVTDMVPVCDTSPASLDLYKALSACSCERAAADMMPGCKDLCADNLCTGGMPSADCGKCVQTSTCSTEFGACAGDI
jgi:hypothetical protein